MRTTSRRRPGRGRALTLLVCLLLGLALGAPLSAQQALNEAAARQQQRAAALLVPGASDAFASPQEQSGMTFGSPDTYRWEGALMGGIIGGLGMGYMFLRVCDDDCAGMGIVGFATGAVLGGFTGMLIGGLFSKHPPMRTADDGRAWLRSRHSGARARSATTGRR